MDGDARIKVLVQAEALRLLAKAVKPLCQVAASVAAMSSRLATSLASRASPAR